MEHGIYLAGISKAELKDLLKEILHEILPDGKDYLGNNSIPDILDVKQAAAFIKARVTTLYEKTSSKTNKMLIGLWRDSLNTSTHMTRPFHANLRRRSCELFMLCYLTPL